MHMRVKNTFKSNRNYTSKQVIFMNSAEAHWNIEFFVLLYLSFFNIEFYFLLYFLSVSKFTIYTHGKLHNSIFVGSSCLI